MVINHLICGCKTYCTYGRVTMLTVAYKHVHVLLLLDRVTSTVSTKRKHSQKGLGLDGVGGVGGAYMKAYGKFTCMAVKVRGGDAPFDPMDAPVSSNGHLWLFVCQFLCLFLYFLACILILLSSKAILMYIYILYFHI